MFNHCPREIFESSKNDPALIDRRFLQVLNGHFLVFDKGSQPTLGQQLTDMRPTVGRQSADKRPTVGRLPAEDFRRRR